jgi:hypothetical protein
MNVLNIRDIQVLDWESFMLQSIDLTIWLKVDEERML